MAQRKVRITIPEDVAADVMFKSDRTCCVCHKAGKQVQIHHVNDNPADNDPDNLAVLCLECHAQTQMSGGFGRKLNAKLVILYRNHWINVVQMRRAAMSLSSELAREEAGTLTSPERSVNPPAPAPATSGVRTTLGQTFRHLGIAITLIDVKCSLSVPLNNSNYRAGSRYETYEETQAGDGAKYVTLVTRVLNDSKVSIDLTCSYPIGNHLVDDRDRKFDSIGELYKVRGNPECNTNLQPGFESDMTWIYRVPLSATIVAFDFEDLTDFARCGLEKPTRIALAVPPPDHQPLD
jgi:hypothetical protein